MVTACMPASVAEALYMKKKAGERAMFVAGGTDIMPAGQTAPVMIYLQGLHDRSLFWVIAGRHSGRRKWFWRWKFPAVPMKI